MAKKNDDAKEHPNKNKSRDPVYGPPAIDWESRAYWEGAGRRELVLQRCRACGVVQHRPRGFCVSCLEGEIEHFVASGRGAVYTYSIVHQNQMSKFRNCLPYVVAYVELEEGPQLLTNLVGCDPETITIGMSVRVDFVPTPDEATGDPLGVPRFVPA
jgi:uncharacterized OB-fold protein